LLRLSGEGRGHLPAERIHSADYCGLTVTLFIPFSLPSLRRRGFQPGSSTSRHRVEPLSPWGTVRFSANGWAGCASYVLAPAAGQVAWNFLSRVFPARSTLSRLNDRAHRTDDGGPTGRRWRRFMRRHRDGTCAFGERTAVIFRGLEQRRDCRSNSLVVPTRPTPVRGSAGCAFRRCRTAALRGWAITAFTSRKRRVCSAWACVVCKSLIAVPRGRYLDVTSGIFSGDTGESRPHEPARVRPVGRPSGWGR